MSVMNRFTDLLLPALTLLDDFSDRVYSFIDSVTNLSSIHLIHLASCWLPAEFFAESRVRIVSIISHHFTLSALRSTRRSLSVLPSRETQHQEPLGPSKHRVISYCI